ncbi:MAG: galactokinase [Ruminococcaceae bacterium]|nr:galactokinase [Oscillospiraceae bacterium]
MNINQLKEEFINRFGNSNEDIRVFASPGRVNLIGEHIDYNGGNVLPAAINMGTTIIARKRHDRKIVLEATDLNDHVELSIDDIESYKKISWGNYQAGIISELINDGEIIVGADLLYHDTIPHGCGLSSSAAIEVATALVFTTFSQEEKGETKDVDMVRMALIGQRAERNYIGVSCGIMDQFASAMGKNDSAVLLNCSTLDYKYVPLNLKGYKIVIANTNKKRSLISSKYNERCEECASALKYLQEVFPTVKTLSEISPEDFEKHKHVIKDDTCKKRAEHVIYEILRVNKSVEALNKGDVLEFGKLINESGDSLRYRYEVTGTELDALVDAARKVNGCVGARMTGAGFGGCTVNIVNSDSIDEFKEKVSLEYKEKIGYLPSFYITDASDGGREIRR